MSRELCIFNSWSRDVFHHTVATWINKWKYGITCMTAKRKRGEEEWVICLNLLHSIHPFRNFACDLLLRISAEVELIFCLISVHLIVALAKPVPVTSTLRVWESELIRQKWWKGVWLENSLNTRIWGSAVLRRRKSICQSWILAIVTLPIGRPSLCFPGCPGWPLYSYISTGLINTGWSRAGLTVEGYSRCLENRE